MNRNYHRISFTHLLILSLILLVISLSFVSPDTAYAATFTVNSNADTNDGTCDAANCTLREAINAANALAGTDTIEFNLSAGNETITLGSLLPIINTPMTIDGDNAAGSGVDVRVSGNNSVRVIDIRTNATLQNIIISDGSNTITTSQAGISFSGAANTLTIINSTIENHVATNAAGLAVIGGTVIVQNSTFRNNQATNDGAAIFSQGDLTVINSTFEGNSANRGAALFRNGGNHIFINSTIANNSPSGSGRVLYGTGTTLTIKNTIIANNSPNSCANIGGIFEAQGRNFDTDGSCVSAATVGAANITQVTTGQLNLGALANNGGPTQTIALNPGSVAINTATDCTDTGGAAIAADQRGTARPQGGTCDVGAYEATGTFRTLTVTATGPGSGTVTDDTSLQFNCTITNGATGGDCIETVLDGTVIDLTAAANAGSTFQNFPICDSIAGNVCTQTVAGGNEIVTVHFTADSTTTITSDNNDPSVFGESYTVAVTVTGPGGTPTGTVDVDDGNGNMCTITLAAGAGSCVISGTPVGAATLTATYNGDANYNVSNDTEPHTVNQGGVTVTINSDLPDPSQVGQNYTVDVTVAATAPAVGTPTGTVDVDDGEGNMCSITLAAGTGNCNLATNTAGAKTLTATYNGDTNFNTGSDTEAHNVQLSEPTFVKNFSSTPVLVGSTVQLTFTVTNTEGAALTNVQFTDTLPATPAGGLEFTGVPGGTCVTTLGANATLSTTTTTNDTLTVDTFDLAATGNANDSCTVIVDVLTNLGGTYNNVSSVITADQGTGTVTATDTLTASVPEPVIAKTFNPDTLNVGNNTVLTFTVTNLADIAITGVNFTDVLPVTGAAELEFTGVPGGTCVTTLSANAVFSTTTSTNDTLTVDTFDLAAAGNANDSCTIIVDVQTNLPGVFVNVSSVVASNEVMGSITANDTLTVTLPEPTITKSFAPGRIDPGGTSTLTFTLINGADIPLTNATFSDVLPITAAGELAFDPLTIGGTCLAAPFNGTPVFSTTVIGTDTLTVNGIGLDVNGSVDDVCTVTVDVQGLVLGGYDNISSVLSATEGSGTIPATATLRVRFRDVDDDVDTAAVGLPPCLLVNGAVNDIVQANVPDSTVTDGSIFCRIINENGVFVQNAAELGTDVLLDYGVLQAVDVFGLTANGNSVPNFNNSIEVCLLGSGMLHYLDATQAPRTLQLLTTTQTGGFTCANIPHAGTLVLTNSTGGAAQQQSSASAPASNTASSTTSVPLSGCRVTTNFIINLRDAASLDSNIIRPIPFDTTYDATERTIEWYRIIVNSGQGWVNAGLVTASGSCGE